MYDNKALLSIKKHSFRYTHNVHVFRYSIINLKTNDASCMRILLTKYKVHRTTH